VPQLPAGYQQPTTSLFSVEEANILNYSPDFIKIATKTREDKFLVLSDTDSPFWKASIDQGQVPILKANYGLRGLYVPKGDHQIVFSFHFYPFYLGLAVTGATILVYFLLLYYLYRQEDRKKC
jgi:uncharacterized membrane protein YfhO